MSTMKHGSGSNSPNSLKHFHQEKDSETMTVKKKTQHENTKHIH